MEKMDMIKERLDSGDQIEKTWNAQYERKSGTIMLSNKKLFFVEEKGFFSKTYNLVLDIPYEKIKKISAEGGNQLVLSELEGRKHIFKTEVGASLIEKSFDDLMPRSVIT